MATTVTTDAACIADLLPLRTALLEGIYSGASSIRHGSKEIVYRSLSDMKAALSKVESDLEACGWTNPADAATRRRRIVKVYAKRPC